MLDIMRGAGALAIFGGLVYFFMEPYDLSSMARSLIIVAIGIILLGQARILIKMNQIEQELNKSKSQ